jgi:ubiquinone/menaquinone biosynthesis C-methylase UbiE
MLSRVLEPEVMDSPQEALDYDRMDHAAVNRLFVDDFLFAMRSTTDGLALGEILDLGTGTAQIPLELLSREGRLSVVATDLSASMLDLARVNVMAAGFSQQIRLERVDAKKLPYPSGRFAAVIANSIVHHIAEPLCALAEACRVLRPEGVLFIRDLLRPEDDAGVRSLVETYAADANDRQRGLFDASLRAALSLDEIRDLVSQLGHDPRQVSKTSDRHWTWSAR